ncbi:hypothetical protein M5X00_26455 [Paenibacillus alvei]|uniref:hypothetical protein n=1 Tax=Paenibacillus alvei TaxID=44250 RepID=UPI00227E3EB4|nr:hypothetical protein [Paenibacillus alvei]MCY9757775.1 hypothetical protein [Paenibacillus alvei]
MKNLITSIIIAICLFIGANNVNACEFQLDKPLNPADIVVTTEKVQTVFYENGWYYLKTFTDKEGGSWVLEIEEAKKPNKAKLDKLKKQYKGKFVDVQYIGDYEYLSWYTLK